MRRTPPRQGLTGWAIQIGGGGVDEINADLRVRRRTFLRTDRLPGLVAIGEVHRKSGRTHTSGGFPIGILHSQTLGGEWVQVDRGGGDRLPALLGA